MKELIIDNFAGGGGASEGIELATKRKVDIAINHDPSSIRLHKTNHPNTKHYCENVWDVDPVEATQGQPVALCWFSPDCKYFSRAKGKTPVDKKIRGLAWVASYCNEEFGTGVGMIKFRNTRIIEEYIPNDYSKEAYEGSLEIEKSKPEDYNIIFDEN